MSNNSIDRRKDLIEKLEKGFQQVKDSERFREYLDTCARFHEYSWNNQMLIWLQRPDATNVAGFQTWKRLGRHVLKGQKGIAILAPMPWRKVEKTEDGDDEVLDEGLSFKRVHVFDVSQTDGRPLPTIVDELQGDDFGLVRALSKIAESERIKLCLNSQDWNIEANGWYSRSDREIAVRPGMSDAMTAKTLTHELAHHFAQHDVNGHCREEAETIAESVAYVVLAHFGIDSAGYSFGYLASWSDDKTFRAKLGEVSTVASRIIDSVSKSAPAPASPAVGILEPELMLAA